MTERQLQRLDRLAEAGLELALATERRAKDAAPEEDLGALAMAYARASRAVRLAGLLQSKLIEQLRAIDANRFDPAFEAVEERKLRIQRAVGRVAQTETDDEDRIERLVHETCDRLDWDDCYGDVMTRPMSDILAEVCRDLGLSPDWQRLADEAWAKEEIESGAVGKPLLSTRPPPQSGGGGPLKGVEGAATSAPPEPPS
jgi:hypothetical protein